MRYDRPPAGMRTTSSSRRRRLVIWGVFLLAAFAYRLGFGLCHEFFSDDETQIFLIGLRHVAGAWPYFGADVVWTQSQIPGGLLGLLVGVPMRIVAVPEAPFVLLNVLSMAALLLLAWYIRRRLPQLPPWLVCGWLMFIPWTLNYGTHVLNPDYLLCAAIVFFVGFFEAHSALSLGVVRMPLALAAMGAAFGWAMQMHMSWPLLGPFVLIILWQRLRKGVRELGSAIIWLAVGASVTGVFLVPTFWRYGILGGGGGTQRNLSLHVGSFDSLVSTLARMLSFPSLEVGRFLGIDTAHRLQLLVDHAWMIPCTAIVWAAGLAQPVWMAIQWFRRVPGSPQAWTVIKRLLVGSVLLVYLSYWLVMEPPQAHSFYVLAPIAFVYAFYCWAAVDSRRTRVLAAVVLCSSVVYHAGLALARAPERSLYRNREVAARAVTSRIGDVLGHRRPYAMEGAPSADVFAVGDEVAALRLVDPSWSPGVRGAVLWTMTLRNDSATNAYRDLQYDTVYRDAAGHVVDVYHDMLADIVQPGEAVRIVRINHGFKPPFASATLRVVRAQRLLPLRSLGTIFRP
jgi:hypothetical protein